MVDEGRVQEGHADALTARAAELVRQMSPETGMVDLASWDAIRRRMPTRTSRFRLWRRTGTPFLKSIAFTRTAIVCL